MGSVASDLAPVQAADTARRRWAVSVLIYVAFAAAVFLAHGHEPLLGPDHVSYIHLADTILADCATTGQYWRDFDSTRTLGVVLAYMHGATGNHVLSMKIVLALVSVPFLLAAELLFRLFAPVWQARLFAVLSAFAVSFGISSWGITDSTALLARTLVAPVVILAGWMWVRFDGELRKYEALPWLVAGSLLHLSAFYMLGVLVVAEVIDWLVWRRARVDRRVLHFAGALFASVVLLGMLEMANLSSKVIGIQVPDMLRGVGVKVENIDQGYKSDCASRLPARKPPPPEGSAVDPPPAVRLPARRMAMVLPVAAPAPAAPAPPPPPAIAAPPATAAEAWAIELKLRPWRNMPLPLVNVANVLSSSALILLLALAGMEAARRSGFTRADRIMLSLFLAVPIAALGPQTLLWWLRSFTGIYPVNIEEVRALGLVMIPAIYFALRLFQRALATGGRSARWKGAAIVAGVLVLPVLMKGLPAWAREQIFSAMASAGVVNTGNEAAVANARAALGLGVAAAPLYYSTQQVRAWLQANTPKGARILTNRDDMILLRDRVVVGPRWLAATAYVASTKITDVFLDTSSAIGARDLARLREIARAIDAQYIVVPWRVEGAAFSDADFSVVKLPAPRGRT